MIRTILIGALVRMVFKGQPFEDYPETAQSLQRLPEFASLTVAEANSYLNGWYTGVHESVRMRKSGA
jgi:hypothetical protein